VIVKKIGMDKSAIIRENEVLS